jgi:SagB-type dehydrogenase family enzyme
MIDQTYKDVIRYHEATKHHFQRYARSAGYMDWQNQPNPFRFYENTPGISLPFLKQDPNVAHKDLYRRSDRQSQPFNLYNIAGFLELSLGLSAWKSTPGNRWSLRINPSSGNLHPTEAHLILPQLDKLSGGVYHYNPLMHVLEQRFEVPPEIWKSIVSHFQTDGFLVALSSIFWREAWKYGERAFRYCNHDVGHALAGLSLAAGLYGWRLTYLNALSDEDIQTILGFDRTQWHPLEEEHPELLCFVYGAEIKDVPRTLPQDIIKALAETNVAGRPNRLSRERLNWKIITHTAAITRKPPTTEKAYDYGRKPFFPGAAARLTAPETIRQRRSATSFDPDGIIDRERFFSILDKTIARNACSPFDAQLGESALHFLLFVHNVDGLERGLYFFVRNQTDAQALKRSFRAEFVWRQVTETLPLYLLRKGDHRHKAIEVSCHQEIAGYSVFSLGMIARFNAILRTGAHRYRHLFWEAGMIGQVLYLEAEAQGVRGTGIGCYFDDPVHEILGLTDNTWQSLYHFTVGHPVEDPRLTTLPPYHHLKESR